MADSIFDLSGQGLPSVSGASRGIGEAIARLLAEHGAHVIVSSRKQEDCEAVAASIVEAGGNSAEAFPCHVGKHGGHHAIFEHIRSAHGRLDICVNNAATNPYFGHILDTDLGAFTRPSR
jgi:NAD(P)-dependent dehydrogenase (short-subunit alcohol dehydrogenase family)